MSLQFSECHTKIRHVDAHATLSDGVVVQVLGELSNNGQPMRKFMQTFVLAPEVSTLGCCYWILTFQWCPEVTFELFTLIFIILLDHFHRVPWQTSSMSTMTFSAMKMRCLGTLKQSSTRVRFRTHVAVLQWFWRTPPPPSLRHRHLLTWCYRTNVKVKLQSAKLAYLGNCHKLCIYLSLR